MISRIWLNGAVRGKRLARGRGVGWRGKRLCERVAGLVGAGNGLREVAGLVGAGNGFARAQAGKKGKPFVGIAEILMKIANIFGKSADILYRAEEQNA